MVGEIYIVDSPKDLGHLIKDVVRYEGTLSAEDLYECGELDSSLLWRWDGELILLVCVE